MLQEITKRNNLLLLELIKQQKEREAIEFVQNVTPIDINCYINGETLVYATIESELWSLARKLILLENFNPNQYICRGILEETTLDTLIDKFNDANILDSMNLENSSHIKDILFKIYSLIKTLIQCPTYSTMKPNSRGEYSFYKLLLEPKLCTLGAYCLIKQRFNINTHNPHQPSVMVLLKDFPKQFHLIKQLCSVYNIEIALNDFDLAYLNHNSELIQQIIE